MDNLTLLLQDKKGKETTKNAPIIRFLIERCETIISENGLEGQGPPDGEESSLGDAMDGTPYVNYKTLKSFENSNLYYKIFFFGISIPFRRM